MPSLRQYLESGQSRGVYVVGDVVVDADWLTVVLSFLEMGILVKLGENVRRNRVDAAEMIRVLR